MSHSLAVDNEHWVAAIGLVLGLPKVLAPPAGTGGANTCEVC